MNIMLTIGIVIYNEENQLQRVEQNLILLSQFQVAVIFVDNSSTDNSADRLDELSRRYGAQLIRRRENHMGAARADVVTHATSEWVGFIDADCEISEAWVRLALRRAQQPGDASAIGGPLLPAGPQKEMYRRLFKSFLGNMNSAQVKNFSEDSLVSHLPTANVIYRRQDLMDVGNFDLTKARVGEDLEMSYRLSEAGKKLRMDPAMSLKHYLPARFFPWVRKVFHYGRARGQVGIKYNVIGTYPFMLPLLFFAFLVSNLVFISEWQGVPLLMYFLLLVASAAYHGGRYSLSLFGYFFSMHLAYSCGMTVGILQGLTSPLDASPMGDSSHAKIKRQ